MAIVPAMQPPPGVSSDFVHPVSLAHYEITFAVFCPVVAFIFVALRMISKIWLTRTLGWDDYMSSAAMVASIAYSASLVARIQYGFGLHLWDVPMTDFFPHLVQWVLAAAVLYALVSLFSKLSILCLYLRIFQVHQLSIWFTYALIVIVTGYTTASALTVIFGCSPVRKAWAPNLHGHCIQTVDVAVFTAVMNVMTDLTIFLLPLPLLWRLRLERRTKIALMVVFLTGAAVVVVSIFRLVATVKYAGEQDVTWYWVRWDVASLFEGNVAILCGCMPAIKPLIQRCLPHIIPPSMASRSHKSSPGIDSFPSRNVSCAEKRGRLDSITVIEHPARCRTAMAMHSRGLEDLEDDLYWDSRVPQPQHQIQRPSQPGQPARPHPLASNSVNRPLQQWASNRVLQQNRGIGLAITTN